MLPIDQVELRLLRQYLSQFQIPSRTPEKLRIRANYAHKEWSKASLQLLKDVIDADPTLYLDEIVDIMAQRLIKKITGSSIYRTIRFRLNYTRKVIYEKAF